MLDRFAARVESMPVGQARAIAFVSIFALGYVDYLSGPEIAFSVFYLLPLAILGWVGARNDRLSLVGAGLAALVWLLADIASGAVYEHRWIPVWNTSTRLLIFLTVMTLLANLRESVAHERELARIDPLTGIANSRSFMERVDYELRRCERERCPITLAYLDLDDFKGINDRHGHAGGDDVLQRVGQALSSNTRTVDIVGRLGGDEFAILLPETGEAGALKVIEALPDRVSAALRSAGYNVTFSLGAVTFLEAPRDLDEMVRAADELMYEVKREGKNSSRHRVVVDLQPAVDG